MWFAGGCAQIMSVPQSSILRMFLLRNQSVDWVGHLLLEKLCCLPNPAMSLGEESTQSDVCCWFGLSQSMLELLCSLIPPLPPPPPPRHPSAPRALRQILFSYRAGSVWWTCRRKHKRQICALCPRDPWSGWALVVTWSNNLEIMITKDMCLRSCL